MIWLSSALNFIGKHYLKFPFFPFKLTFKLWVQYMYYNQAVATTVCTLTINICETSSYLFACCRIWSISKVKWGLGDLIGCRDWWFDTDGIGDCVGLKKTHGIFKNLYVLILCCELKYNHGSQQLGELT